MQRVEIRSLRARKAEQLLQNYPNFRRAHALVKVPGCREQRQFGASGSMAAALVQPAASGPDRSSLLRPASTACCHHYASELIKYIVTFMNATRLLWQIGAKPC